MPMLGAASRMLLVFGTRVHVRNREWKRRDDKAWRPRTVKGRLVGPAPQSLSAYVVMLEDNTLYISSSVHPLPTDITPKPKFRHGHTQPLGSIRALLVSAGGESLKKVKSLKLWRCSLLRFQVESQATWQMSDAAQPAEAQGKVPRVRDVALAGESPCKASGAVQPVEVLGKVARISDVALAEVT